MKSRTLLASMALLASAASLLSCSDNNDDKPATPAAKEITGTYKGDMTSSVMGSESVFEDMTVTVAAPDAATATLTISSFGNPPMQIPGITISGVKVSGEDGVYTLTTTAFSGQADSGTTYSGTAKGSYADGTIDIQFSLQYGAMPMPLICSFAGKKE